MNVIITLGEGKTLYQVIYPEIGNGTFGIVYKTTQQSACVKKITSSVDLAIDELKVIRKLQESRYIVRFIDFYKPGNDIWVVMEYCNLGNLGAYMAHGEPVNLARQVRIIQQSAQALEYLHHNDMTHRDMKHLNILLTCEHGDNVVKLCDFGLAKAMSRDMTTVAGTAYFMAPEMFDVFPRYDKSVDTFALGLVALCMLTHELKEDVRKWRPCTVHYYNKDLPENYSIGREIFAEMSKGKHHLAIVPRDPTDDTYLERYKDVLHKIVAVNMSERMDAHNIAKEMARLSQDLHKPTMKDELSYARRTSIQECTRQGQEQGGCYGKSFGSDSAICLDN